MHSTKLYRPLSSVFMVANKRFGPVDKTGDKGVAKNPAFSLSHSSSDSEIGNLNYNLDFNKNCVLKLSQLYPQFFMDRKSLFATIKIKESGC